MTGRGERVIGRRVAVFPVPGDHELSLTRQLEATAARLRACLEAESGR